VEAALIGRRFAMCGRAGGHLGRRQVLHRGGYGTWSQSYVVVMNRCSLVPKSNVDSSLSGGERPIEKERKH
jgi:hypothetical protein